jgi:2-polyprenyl-3-methyl-5-hydroxy-6-metoxy-1,4-benzoquinol methylase
MKTQEVCEICSGPMRRWHIGGGSFLLKCENCEHMKRDIMLCPAKARESARGGNDFADRVRLYLSRKRLMRIVPSLSDKKTILEVGFGKGELLKSFLSRGHEAHGVEPEYSEVKTDAALEHGLTIIFEKLEDAHLPNEKFDLIYALHVVEHLENVHLALRKCFDSLKRGGLLFLVTPNGISSSLRIFGQNWWYLEDPTHCRFFSPTSIRIALEEAGFGGIQVRKAVWDSITLENNSLLRSLRKETDTEATYDRKFAVLLNAALLPISFTRRILRSDITPSMEIVAKKGGS